MIYFDEFMERFRSEISKAGNPPPLEGGYFDIHFKAAMEPEVYVEVVGLGENLSLRYRKKLFSPGVSSPWAYGRGLWVITGVSSVGKIAGKNMTLTVETSDPDDR